MKSISRSPCPRTAYIAKRKRHILVDTLGLPIANRVEPANLSDTIEDAIREYRFVYHPDSRQTEMDPPLAIPRLSEFPPDLGQLFIKAFGREGPRGGRPAAEEWLAPLDNLARNLRKFSTQDTHHYYQALSTCLWCRVENAFGRAMFGFKLTLDTGRGFDLVAVWAQIDSVRADEPNLAPPSVSAYVSQPDPRILELKKRRRVNRALSVVSILLAVVIVARLFFGTAVDLPTRRGDNGHG